MKYLIGIVLGIQLCLCVVIFADWYAHPELTEMQMFQRHSGTIVSVLISLAGCLMFKEPS